MWRIDEIPENRHIIILYYDEIKKGYRSLSGVKVPRDELMAHAARYNLTIETDNRTLLCEDAVLAWYDINSLIKEIESERRQQLNT